METTAATTPKFIHCDCDCFFAAIEIRDDPSLRGLPVAVGGSEHSRGVIATCNYEARKYGIHSAMASATARRLCRDLVIIPGNMEKYRIASHQIRAIFADYTDLIEPLSLDEAYLDVTHAEVCKGSATLIAREIRRRVRDEIRITVSAGIAPNKFLAKIASDWNKPDGQFVITPAMVPAFVARLPVKKLHGVGKVTTRKMQDLGIETCQDLQTVPLLRMLELFGSFGERLYSLCRGIDERKLQTDWQRKSISVEHTFSTDLDSVEQCLAALPALLPQLEARIQGAKGRVAIAKQFVKLRFNDFVSTTVEQGCAEISADTFRELCKTGFERGNKPVRLLGLGVRMKEPVNSACARQLELRFTG
ncbi:MAG: DNA polymerase IV [Pseudomonadales bacterium]|nr:DNA polymerase IV [Pseudomonadales bacterium]